MSPRLSTLNDLPTPMKAGLALASGGGIMAALWYMLPPGLFWVILIGIAVVALVVLSYWRLVKWRRKRKAAPMERGVIDNTSATPQGISEAAHVAKLDDLRKKFEAGVAKFRTAGKSLYNFPWYVIVGEPGSGKTEAIRHCNIGFPPGLQDEFQGAGGTLNMNWWFTDQAVILDTAGRLMFEDVETGGSAEWKEFLKLLKKYRSRCPINGIILVIPADSLIKDSSEEIERKASKIARQFDVIQRTLDVRFPVFVIVTKSDLISGFRDFFDDLDEPHLQHQIMGWSNHGPLDEPYNEGFVDQQLKSIRERLFRRRLGLLQQLSDEPGTEASQTTDTLFALPQSIAKIAPRMARYLELIFSVGSQWSCKPLFFRGIYFTSSMREGSALDQDLAESLGVPVDSLPEGRVWEQERAYFLRDLFVKKIFRENGLVTNATNASKQHSRRRAAVLISGIVGIFLLALFTIYAVRGFNKSIGRIEPLLRNSTELLNLNRPDGFAVWVRRGPDDWLYKGAFSVDSAIDEMPDITRAHFAAELLREAKEFEVPLILKPAEKILRFKSEQLPPAVKAIYEIAVLRPFIEATCDVMDTQIGGNWTANTPNSNALRQLIRIKAKKPLAVDPSYSAANFLDPLFDYLVGPNSAKIINKYEKEDRAKLHAPLSMPGIFGANWAPGDLNACPNSMNHAITNGVKLFNEYWTDPNRTVASNKDYDFVTRLDKAIADFNDIETHILSLTDKLNPEPDEPYDINKLKVFADAWGADVNHLERAKSEIEKLIEGRNSLESLPDMWTNASESILKDVDAAYEILLDELNDPNLAEKAPLLEGIRKSLVEARDEFKNNFTADRAEHFKQIQRHFYTKLGGKHLFQIRCEMYAAANNQLRQKPDNPSIPDISEAVSKINDKSNGAKDAITKLQEIDRGNREPFRLQEAAEDSRLAIDAAWQFLSYSAVKYVLEEAPKSKDELDKLVIKHQTTDKTEWPEDFVKITEEIDDSHAYDPCAAKIIAGWKYLGDVLESQKIPDAMSLKNKHADANGIFTDYTNRYINHWLGAVPGKWIESELSSDGSWKGRLSRFEKLNANVEKVFDDLSKLGSFIKATGLSAFEDYAKRDDRLRQFEQNTRLARENSHNTYTLMLTKWCELSNDPFVARKTLLKLKPDILCDTYFAKCEKSYFSSIENPSVGYVDRYWTELACSSLSILADEIDNKKGGELEKLREYAKRFPLVPNDVGKDLSVDDLHEARRMIKMLLPLEEPGSGTVWGGAQSQVPRIEGELTRLRKAFPSDQPWAQRVSKILNALPTFESKDKKYYCKVSLVDWDKQDEWRQDGNDLSSYFTVFTIEQENVSKSKPLLTKSKGDKKVGIIEYPGPPVVFRFFEFDTSPSTESLVFPGEWACLRMLREHHDEDKQERGIVKLEVKGKRGLGGVWFLHLEFFTDKKCQESSLIEDFPPSDWYR